MLQRTAIPKSHGLRTPPHPPTQQKRWHWQLRKHVLFHQNVMSKTEKHFSPAAFGCLINPSCLLWCFSPHPIKTPPTTRLEASSASSARAWAVPWIWSLATRRSWWCGHLRDRKGAFGRRMWWGGFVCVLFGVFFSVWWFCWLVFRCLGLCCLFFLLHFVIYFFEFRSLCGCYPAPRFTFWGDLFVCSVMFCWVC